MSMDSHHHRFKDYATCDRNVYIHIINMTADMNISFLPRYSLYLTILKVPVSKENAQIIAKGKQLILPANALSRTEE